jgi:hypothetical protein
MPAGHRGDLRPGPAYDDVRAAGNEGAIGRLAPVPSDGLPVLARDTFVAARGTSEFPRELREVTGIALALAIPASR